MELHSRFFLLICALGMVQLTLGFLHNLKEGDLCYTRDSMSGVCRKIRKCKGALERIKSQKMKIKLCSYGQEPIICCPNYETTMELKLQEDNKTRFEQQDTLIFKEDNKMRFEQQESYIITEKKCSEYGQYRFVTRELETLSVFSETIREEKCKINGETLIVGGTLAESGEFPHMVALGRNDDNEENKILWVCGGSLISEQFVLTAAHCKYSNRVPVKFARLGSINLEMKLPNEETEPMILQVVQFIGHEQYKKPYKYNDIALAKLEKSVVFGPYLRPACLHTNDADLSKFNYLTATGWGFTDTKTRKVSDSLMKVSLKMITHSDCQKGYPRSSPEMFKGVDDETMICAGDPEGKKDTCMGDSGGPLQVSYKSVCKYSIVAITSLGSSECESKYQAGIYTRISYYVPWIQKHVWPQDKMQ